MNRQRAFAFVVPIGSVALTLGLVELVLALARPVPYAVERNMYFRDDPHTGYRMQPDSVGSYGEIPARANRAGHRDEEAAVPKPPGRFRILALGDSFGVGANVEQREAYPQVLEELLRDRNVDVVNASVGGWSPFQYAAYFEHHGSAFEPDLILVGVFVGNDVFINRHSLEQTDTAIMGRRVSRDAARSRWIRAKVLLYEHSHLARLLMVPGEWQRDRTLERARCNDFQERHLDTQRRRLPTHLLLTHARRAAALMSAAHILRLKRLAGNVPVVVALIPDETQINRDLQDVLIPPADRDRYDLDQPQRLLRKHFGDAGIHVIDLRDAFRDDPRCLYRNDAHWTPEGHTLAARELARGLVESSLVR